MRDERQHAAAHAHTALLIGLLEKLAAGLAIVDGERRIVFANRIARETIAARDGLLDRRGTLALSERRSNASLRRLIAGVLDEARDERGAVQRNAGGFLTVERPSGKRPYVLHVAPFDATGALGARGDLPAETGAAAGTGAAENAGPSGARYASVCITDTARRPAATDHYLAEVHGLSTAEARLAAQLAAGTALYDAAETLGIAKETARSQLKAIFRKTGTHHQGALVRLILSGMPAFARSADA